MPSVLLAVSVSERSRFPTQDQSPLAHVLSLSRSSITSIHVLLTKHVQRTFVLDRSGFSSLVWSRFISRSMVLLPRLNSFPLPGSGILTAHFSFSFCKSYGSFASALHRYGVCFASNEIDSFANELSTCQIEKKAFA